MGRKPKKHPKEGEQKSMKKLTEGHDQLMKDRNKDRKEMREDGKDAFEELLKKAIKHKKA